MAYLWCRLVCLNRKGLFLKKYLEDKDKKAKKYFKHSLMREIKWIVTIFF